MRRRSCIALAVAGLSFAGASVALADAPVEGTWAPHKNIFTFMGFTSRYSCDGLQAKLTALLRLSGARPDFKVVSTCAAPGGVPDRISTVRLSYHTLVPAGSPVPAANPKDATPPGPPEHGVGTWRNVELTARMARDIESGDCELVEQFAKEILPTFTTKDVVNRMSCVPNQSNTFGINLKYSVLAALPPPKQAPVSGSN